MAYEPPRPPLSLRLLLCVGIAVTVANTYHGVVRRDLRQNQRALEARIAQVKQRTQPLLDAIERHTQTKGHPPELLSDVTSMAAWEWEEQVRYYRFTRERWVLSVSLGEGRRLVTSSDGRAVWDDEARCEAVGEGWYLYTPR